MLTIENTHTLPALAKELLKCDNFVICGHVNPDGDCLGSQLALAAALRACNKQVTCVLADTASVEGALAAALPNCESLVSAGEFASKCNTFVSVDVHSKSRIGSDACKLLSAASHTFVIDHHATANESVTGKHYYIDPNAASNTLLIWQLIAQFGIEITPEIATCCYVGLCTDTGRFQFQNTDALCLRLGAEMLECGVDAAAVAREVFQNRTEASLRLEALAVSKMEVNRKAGYVISYLTKEELQKYGAKSGDTSPIIDALRCTAGIRVACMLRERNGVVRASLRAKDDVDVSKIAQQFEGGGHIAAAGCTLQLPMEDAYAAMKAAITKAVETA